MPGHPEARLNRGIALARLEQPANALAEFDAVLAMSPGNPMAHYNRGIALFDLGPLRRCDCGLRADASRSSLTMSEALNNRGLALQALNRFQEALASYSKAIDIQRDYADAHFDRALALLTVASSVGLYGIRVALAGRTGMPAERRGHGRPLLARRVSVAAQDDPCCRRSRDLGDTIQFARYVPLIARRAQKSSWRSSGKLVPLLANIEGAAGVVARDEPLPAVRRSIAPWAACRSRSRPSRSTIPAEIPYLRADAARVGHVANAHRRKAKGPATHCHRLGRKSSARTNDRKTARSRLRNLRPGVLGGRGLRRHPARAARRGCSIAGRQQPRDTGRR